MLHKSFKPAKCKTSLKLALARIKLLRNKRQEQVKLMRRELAQLLDQGQDQTARIRVEHVIREEKTMSAYDLIELYCELIVARLPIIESQKSCPFDLKEAISSVIFASPRCADLAELMDIRKHFASKYGKDFINSALEVRPDCGVSRLVVEKLSARAPDVETKVKMLASIAQEHNVKWDSKAFEEQHQKPHDDLLNGPNTFVSASKMPTMSSNVNSSSSPSQTNEPSVKMPQNDAASRPTSFSTSSQTNTRTPVTTVPRSSESRSGGAEAQNSYFRGENAPLNLKNWNMDFQDAASAAQAAAESAEMASMAARAAAELASRGHMSRKNSHVSNDESPSYNTKFERPENLRGLLGDNSVEESVTNRDEALKGLQDVKTEVHNYSESRKPPSRSSSRSSQAYVDDKELKGLQEVPTKVQNYSEARKPPSRSSSHSSQAYVDDEELKGLHEVKTELQNYSESWKPPSRSSSRSSQAYVDDDSLDVNPFSQDNKNVIPRKVFSSHHDSTFDDEKFMNSSIHKHEDDEGEFTRMSAGESFSGSTSQKLFNSGDHNGVVFDDYESDTEDNHSLFGRNRGNLWDSYQEEKSSIFQSKHLSSINQYTSGSQLLFKESSPDEHSSTKFTFPSQSYDSVLPAFDDYDRKGTESEEEVANYLVGKRDDNVTMRSSKGYEEIIDTDSYFADELQRRASSTSLPRSQPSPRSRRASTNSNDLVRGFDYEEEPQPLPSMSLGTDDVEISNDFGNNDSVQMLNFGSLAGGFKQRGFPQPPYVRSSSSDASRLSKKTSSGTSTRTYNDPDSSNEQSHSVDSRAYRESVIARADKVTPSDSNKTGASSKVQSQNLYDQELQRKAPKESSSRINYLDSDGSEANLDSNYIAGSRGNADVKLSRRTRDIALQRKGSNLKPPSLYNVTNTTGMDNMPSRASIPAPETLSDKAHDAFNIQRGSYKHLLSYPSDEQTSVSPKQTSPDSVVPTNKGTPKLSSSSGDSTSREGSFKNASHTHPKLPDYDTLAAHFRSLRSNQL